MSEPKRTMLTREELAQRTGVSPVAIGIFEAAGMPGPNTLDYCPVVNSLAKVAESLGVSRRTAVEYKAKGIIQRIENGEAKGQYCPVDARRRRLLHKQDQRQGPTVEELTGHADLDRRVATGDLARAVLRFYRTEIQKAVIRAVHEVSEEEPENGSESKADVAFRVGTLLLDKLRPILLEEPEIEEVIQDCWGLV